LKSVASSAEMKRSRLAQWVWRLLALLALGGWAAPSAPEPILVVEAGYAGAIRPGRYFPIRVAVTWTHAPGEGLVAAAAPARLEVRLPHDQLNAVRLTRDVTIQPGVRATFVLHARSLVDVSELEVELRDARGRLLARAKPQSNGPAGWWPIDSESAIVLAVGRSSMPRSGWAFIPSAGSPIRIAELNAPDLPREWPGYDAVSLVLLGDLGADRLDAGQLATLLEWVHRGGHLAITATDQLESFNQVLGDQKWPIALGEYSGGEFDAGVGAALKLALSLTTDADAAAVKPGPSSARRPVEFPMSWYQMKMPALRAALDDLRGRFLYRRPIQVTEQGAAPRWGARWSHQAFDPQKAPSNPGASLTGDIVCGLYGLGTITLLGIDPANLAGAAGGEVRGVAWWHCLNHIPEIYGALTPRATLEDTYWSGRQGGFEQILASRATNSILDELSAGYGTRQGLFAAIAVALLLLVALIGPVDYFVLRRLKREPLTWITTPVLIALACAAIYLSQDAVSYGTARLARLSVIDAWSGAEEGVATSFTAVASNRGGRYSLEGLNDGVFGAPACWNPSYWYYGPEKPSSMVSIHHTPAGARIGSMRIPLENVRWMEDRGPMPIPAVSGSVAFNEARDEVVLNLTAPAGAIERLVGVWWNERWYGPAGGGTAFDAPSIIGQVLPRAAGDEEALKRRRQPEGLDPWSYYQSNWQHGWTRDLEFQIPGHRHVESRLTTMSPDVAAVILELKGRSQVQLVRNGSPIEAQWQERRLLRLFVPAERFGRAAEESEP